VAFLSGLVFRQINLPPMVGFLLAGFVLHSLGVENDPFLLAVADMGVTLLLFTIGLKLRVSTLARPEIWATTTVHMVFSVVLTVAIVSALAWAGVLLFEGADFTAALIVAFALSFSSTVFAVKTLEDRGAFASRYGQVAIGILVLQDVAAVVFLAASAGKLPSVWALALVLLIPGRHILGRMMNASGHRELLILFGFVMALGGAALFEVVGMKGDLGALVVGVLLAQHAKANELAKTLMSFKDVFLVCFFLTIGLTGLPTWNTAAAALILLALVPVKAGMFVYLLTRFRMRARGATFAGLVLGNYSEFGLIVAAIAIKAGWLSSDWLTVIALALSASFILASPVNVHAISLYTKYRDHLTRLERPERLPGDEDIQLSGNRILVFGMGRVGRATYDEMASHVQGQILGIDLDETQVEINAEFGRNVVLGDATNPEFWSRVRSPNREIEMILLAMPHHAANIEAAIRLREQGYSGPIVATALYPDQEQELKENGIDEVFNIYAEAGSAAAAHMHGLLEGKKT